MCLEARRLRLAGWVRNRRDGGVEAVALGDETALRHLAEWARHGPPGSQVDDMNVRAATDAEAADADQTFSQRSSV